MKIKDVVLEKSNWKQTRQSLSHVTEVGDNSNVSSSYAAYNQTSPYYNYSSSYGDYSGLSGFAKDINEIVEISKSIQDLIDSKDEDGVCHYSYNDEVSAARNVQGKLDTLMRYACQVEKAIENQIDHKFYEEIDKVFYNLEQLQIQNYKTKNIIGYQRKETITGEYGQTVEYMVIPEDVSITDLYSVDNIYSEQLKDEYKEYKAYYPDIEISESDYLVSTLNSRYFNYDSLYEQQMHVENIRGWLLLGVTIITGIVCPPAALAIGFGFGALEVGSAIAGRDYLTGRKMEKGERIQRGIFGALDMLPGVVVIAKQFEYGRKILNTVGKLKAKALNFVKDTYDIGKSKLTSAYNSLITKIDNFENSIIRQIDDAFVGNSRLRPAFAGVSSDLSDDVSNAFLKSADEVLDTTTVNIVDDSIENIKLKATSAPSETDASKSLLNENGVFIDEELEIKYNKYVNKKIKQGKVPRDRLDWKETVDWYQNSPIHRGNKFNHNAKFTQTDLLHEVHLENGKRLDSYNYEDGLIISRKATDLDKISEETYRQYLAEIEKKYSVGTKIQSNKYHKYKGKELQGKYVLEIPLSNKDLPNISHFEEIAKEYNVTLQYLKE